MQIAICLIYSFLIKIPPYNPYQTIGDLSFTPIITIVLLFIMVVLGNDIIFIGN
jgi:hypothetical protein